MTNPKLKIAVCSPVFPPYPGGIGNVAFYQALELAHRGHDLFVFTPKTSFPLKENYTENHQGSLLKIIRLTPLLKWGNGALLPQLLWRLKGFDLVNLHYPFFGGAEVLAFFFLWQKLRKRRSPKFVITYHMDVVGQGIWQKFFRFHSRYIMPYILKLAEKIIVTTFDYAKNSNLSPLIKKFPKKFQEIPCGVLINHFLPQKKDKELLEKHHLSLEDKIVLFVGTLDYAHYFKGVDYLIRAISLIEDERVKLLIVGEGELKREYQKLTKKLTLEKRVIFVGGVENGKLPLYYNLADLFVLPSIDKSEAFGLVILEAMACGKPVIASSLPGVRTLIKEGETGYLVEPKNEGALANQIINLFLKPHLLEEMGKKARERVEKEYSWKIIGDKLEKLFLSLL